MNNLSIDILEPKIIRVKKKDENDNIIYTHYIVVYFIKQLLNNEEPYDIIIPDSRFSFDLRDYIQDLNTKCSNDFGVNLDILGSGMNTLFLYLVPYNNDNLIPVSFLQTKLREDNYIWIYNVCTDRNERRNKYMKILLENCIDFYKNRPMKLSVDIKQPGYNNNEKYNNFMKLITFYTNNNFINPQFIVERYSNNTYRTLIELSRNNSNKDLIQIDYSINKSKDIYETFNNIKNFETKVYEVSSKILNDMYKKTFSDSDYGYYEVGFNMDINDNFNNLMIYENDKKDDIIRHIENSINYIKNSIYESTKNNIQMDTNSFQLLLNKFKNDYNTINSRYMNVFPGSCYNCDIIGHLHPVLSYIINISFVNSPSTDDLYSLLYYKSKFNMIISYEGFYFFKVNEKIYKILPFINVGSLLPLLKIKINNLAKCILDVLRNVDVRYIQIFEDILHDKIYDTFNDLINRIDDNIDGILSDILQRLINTFPGNDNFLNNKINNIKSLPSAKDKRKAFIIQIVLVFYNNIKLGELLNDQDRDKVRNNLSIFNGYTDNIFNENLFNVKFIPKEDDDTINYSVFKVFK